MTFTDHILFPSKTIFLLLDIDMSRLNMLKIHSEHIEMLYYNVLYEKNRELWSMQIEKKRKEKKSFSEEFSNLFIFVWIPQYPFGSFLFVEFQ